MKRSLATINYHELKASIRKYPILGNGKQWWESGGEIQILVILLFQPLAVVGEEYML